METKLVRVDDLVEVCDAAHGEALADVRLLVIEGNVAVYRLVENVAEIPGALEVTTDDGVPRFFRRPYDLVSVVVM